MCQECNSRAQFSSTLMFQVQIKVYSIRRSRKIEILVSGIILCKFSFLKSDDISEINELRQVTSAER